MKRATNILILFILAAFIASALPQTSGVPQLAPGESLGKALGLNAALNLRDMGGYRTANGNTIAGLGIDAAGQRAIRDIYLRP
jgi:hypothetical protein